MLVALMAPTLPAQLGTALGADATSVDEFVTRALQPFWRTREMREPLFLIQAKPETPPSARLLFRPNRIISVTSATRETVYEAGKDYDMDLEAGVLSLPEGSRIPFKTLDQLYPLMTSDEPKIRRQQGDATRGVFFDNEAGYHKLQIEVTYRCAPNQWQGYEPKFAGNLLSRTVSKLRDKQPIRLVLSGDSISAGYNASSFTKVSPGCPSYGELVGLALTKHYGSRVDFINHAVSGWTSAQGLEHAVEQQFGKHKPDLVILAYGMNDVFARDAATFQKNIKGIIDTIRARSPGTEFVLVSSMLGNAEWGMPMEQFSLYHDALQELCGQGVVLADLTAIWREMLRRKSFYDLTGNGVNHPNDFGHCVYAQTIVSLLVPPKSDGARTPK